MRASIRLTGEVRFSVIHSGDGAVVEVTRQGTEGCVSMFGWRHPSRRRPRELKVWPTIFKHFRYIQYALQTIKRGRTMAKKIIGIYYVLAGRATAGPPVDQSDGD